MNNLLLISCQRLGRAKSKEDRSIHHRFLSVVYHPKSHWHSALLVLVSALKDVVVVAADVVHKNQMALACFGFVVELGV